MSQDLILRSNSSGEPLAVYVLSTVDGTAQPVVDGMIATRPALRADEEPVHFTLPSGVALGEASICLSDRDICGMFVVR